MSKPNTLIANLIRIKNEENGTAVFKFVDGTKQTQKIQPGFFYDKDKKPLDLQKVVQNLNNICHDLGAVDYEVE